MTKKKEKAEWIKEHLQKLYPKPHIPLSHESPFTLLIAVLLSAQCTDERVNQVTPNLFALATTPKEMMLLSIETIKDIIKPCGLFNNKAKAIHELSTILTEKYDEQVPTDIDLLELLPGVGHKTASVMMIQAFNTPAFPVDTHIHRLAKRWKLSNGSSVKKTEEDLKKLFPKEAWADLHLQMIYYGREFCPARGHDVEKCTICKKLA